jgi:hypothetical protein
MDENKIGMGLGVTVDPQRGPGAEPLVGVKGAKPPMKVTLFSRNRKRQTIDLHLCAVNYESEDAAKDAVHHLNDGADGLIDDLHPRN